MPQAFLKIHIYSQATHQSQKKVTQGQLTTHGQSFIANLASPKNNV
jgi:hypothetical protein